MTRYLWALCFACLMWLGFSASAGAEELHVCVRPPDVPASVGRWAYDGNKQVVVKSAEEFRQQSKGLTVYVYDAAAPPESVSLLPAKHQHLACPGATPSPPKPPPVASEAPPNAPKPAGSGGAGTGQGGTGKGASGEKRTVGDKVAAELAIAGAIATGQMNEDLKNPTGKKYGIPGGKNPNGPNSPVAQAAAGVVLVAAGVLTEAAFRAKLTEAVEKKIRLLLTEKTLSNETLKRLTSGKLGRYFADALNKIGAIGPYSVMKAFTANHGSQWQAHHLIEQKFVKDLGLGTTESGLSVILTDVEHKAITKKLTVRTAGVKTPAQLWKAYKEVYVDHPHWLEAIKGYFVKGK